MTEPRILYFVRATGAFWPASPEPGPVHFIARASVLLEPSSMYIAFLDEFGHIGPFIGRADPRYNHSPVFGLAGFIMPHHKVRHFATWFYQQKNYLLARELRASRKHPSTWEKKGIEVFTTRGVKKYGGVRLAAFRLFNEIYKCDGRIFYYGRQKYLTPAASKATGLYTTVLGHSVTSLDHFCTQKTESFLIILDQHTDRLRLIETAAKSMFGTAGVRSLIEPPFQVESHLYQTIQAADWIASLVGRVLTFRVAPDQYPDWEWAERYFGTRIDGIATHSALWRPRPRRGP